MQLNRLPQEQGDQGPRGGIKTVSGEGRPEAWPQTPVLAPSAAGSQPLPALLDGSRAGGIPGASLFAAPAPALHTHRSEPPRQEILAGAIIATPWHGLQMSPARGLQGCPVLLGTPASPSWSAAALHQPEPPVRCSSLYEPTRASHQHREGWGNPIARD